ncbi:MAG: Tol-Pal system beta propeller repeat protein TolB [Micavibrio sp.]|nr:Tol-Pal system beta propeller repeat protein TolB [Micavibrio sp.]|tara:strand:- start:2710 stop:4029 length:1320 start_codon:yes stop_codon:yes gene_type:complete
MKKLFTVLFVMMSFVSVPSHAELTINLTKGQVEALPTAIPDFYSETSASQTIATQMTSVIKNDLKSSGLFRMISESTYLQSSESVAKEGPRFSEWGSIGTQALITGVVKDNGPGSVRVEFRLWDTLTQSQLIGTAYTTEVNNWRRIAHIIADAIFERVTGEKGYFDSRIVYVAEEGPANRRIKRLAIMDQDGQNHKFLTNGQNLVLTPRFSPSQQQITYLAYVNNKPRVYLYNIDTGQQQVLGDFKGMTFAPRFSPDGNSVVMSLSQNGNSEIYDLNLRSRKVTQLTNNPGIDTSPSYSPDGSQIVFESDRGGTQQLYVMSANGANPHRITFGDGRYANPVWSPRGDMIAFTRMYKGQFYIGVIRPDGTGERLITTAFHVEGPSWAPNGRYLVYFKEKPSGQGGTQRSANLYTIDLTGHNERLLPTPLGGSDPAWSPLN